MNLLSSTAIFSFFTLISRILGYLRDILIAIFLGASILADVFFVAFRLPNTFRRLFAEGTFNAAFIPSYTKERLTSDRAGKMFADDVLRLVTISLLFLVLLVEIFTPIVIFLIAPGFFQDSIKYDLVIELARITFPFLLFVSVSSLFSGVLNSHNKFAAAAAAPIILNVVLIVILLVSYFFNTNFVKNLSYGVTGAGILQMLFLMYFAKKFYKPSFEFKNKVNKKVKFFIKKLIPSIFSSGVTQINILVGTIIASFQAGAVSYLYYADRVYQINLAIAGIAVSIVSLPALSRAIKKKNKKNIFQIQNKSIELTFLLSIPASIGLIIASEEIVSSLFGYGSFSEEDVKLTSKALLYFGYGVPAFALVKVLGNLFFARDDTKTPLKISLLIVALNILISVFFFSKIGFIIIPIATTTSSWIGIIIYFFILNEKKFLNIERELFKNLAKIFLCSFLMSLLLIYGIGFFSDELMYSNTFKFLYLLFIVTFVAIIYLISCNLLGLLKFKNYKTI